MRLFGGDCATDSPTDRPTDRQTKWPNVIFIVVMCALCVVLFFTGVDGGDGVEVLVRLIDWSPALPDINKGVNDVTAADAEVAASVFFIFFTVKAFIEI